MPWYVDGVAPEYTFANAHRLVAPWPAPEGPRIDCRFRMNYGEYLPAPRPSQFFIRLDREQGSTDPMKNGSLKVLPVSATKLSGTTGVSADGYEFVLDIELFEDPAKEPNFLTSGIRYTVTVKVTGFPDLVWHAMHSIEGPAAVPFVPLLVGHAFNLSEPFKHYSNYDPGVHTWLVHSDESKAIEFFPLSECLVIPEPPPLGEARFNGVDAWIQFDIEPPPTGTAHLLEYDILSNLLDNKVVLGSEHSTTKWHGFQGAFHTWRGVTVSMITPLPIGTYVHMRWERNWTIMDNRTYTFMDGVPNGDALGTPDDIRVDQLGKRGPTINGIFDLRNLKYTEGTIASPLVRIDMPLATDACDLGPLGIKGTTFNMTLPSCP